MKEDIILYGTGVTAEKFYWKWKETYNILYCIGEGQALFHEKRVYPPCEIKREHIKQRIIVAVNKETYPSVRKWLMSLGFIEFDDFLWNYELGKDLVILYGNCHMHVLEKYLNSVPDFAHQYVIRKKTVFEQEDFERIPTKEELLSCKVLITQDINQENSQSVPSADCLLHMVSPNCRTVKIPNLYGYNLFYPQLSKLAARHGVTTSHTEAIGMDTAKIRWEFGLVFNYDENIARLHRAPNAVNQIVDIMTSSDFYKHDVVIENFKNQIQRIQEREMECDITISDFLLDNYKERQLFYDPQHPTEVVIIEKGKRILRRLGIHVPVNVIVSPMLNDTELFIYDSVRSALGLSYRQEYIRVGQEHASLQSGCLSREEYIREMLAWNYEIASKLN